MLENNNRTIFSIAHPRYQAVGVNIIFSYHTVPKNIQSSIPVTSREGLGAVLWYTAITKDSCVSPVVTVIKLKNSRVLCEKQHGSSLSHPVHNMVHRQKQLKSLETYNSTHVYTSSTHFGSKSSCSKTPFTQSLVRHQQLTAPFSPPLSRLQLCFLPLCR